MVVSLITDASYYEIYYLFVSDKMNLRVYAMTEELFYPCIIHKCMTVIDNVNNHWHFFVAEIFYYDCYGKNGVASIAAPVDDPSMPSIVLYIWCGGYFHYNAAMYSSTISPGVCLRICW